MKQTPVPLAKSWPECPLCWEALFYSLRQRPPRVPVPDIICCSGHPPGTELLSQTEGIPRSREGALPCLAAHSASRWCIVRGTADGLSWWQAPAPLLWWAHGQGPATGWLVPSPKMRSAEEGRGVTTGSGPGDSGQPEGAEERGSRAHQLLRLQHPLQKVNLAGIFIDHLRDRLARW